MYRAVLTLLVGLMLSFGGGANALTFKSDGTVVQKGGAVLQKGAIEKDEMGWKYQDFTKQVVGWTFNKKAALAKRAFDESDKFQRCLRKVGFTKFNELSVVGSVCFSDLISGKFDTAELILSANEPWHAANSKSYEKLALKYWCIANLTGENVRAEPFLDAKGKRNKSCLDDGVRSGGFGNSPKDAPLIKPISYQAVKEFFSQESQKQTLCSRVKPFASYEEVAALKLSDSNKSALSYFLLARDIGLSCREEKSVENPENQSADKVIKTAETSQSGTTETTISLGSEFPKFMSTLTRTCKNPAGDIYDRTNQIFFDDDHLIGWDSGAGGIAHVTGTRTENGTIKIQISSAGNWRGAWQNYLEFSWQDSDLDGFFSIGKQKILAQKADGKDECFLSIRHSDPSTAPVISIRADRDTSFQIKTLKNLDEMQSAALKKQQGYGLTTAPRFNFLAVIPRIGVAEVDSENLNRKDEIETEEAKALRLAKLEEERKAKEAEALRLAKLEEERKAKEAEASRRAKLEEERKAKEDEALRLAKIEEERKAKEAEARRLAEADKSPPKIFAEVVSQDGYDALIRGVITDDTGLQDIAMNGQILDLDGFGVFEESIYIPRGGKLVTIEAIDKLGKLARFELKLERRELAKLTLASFEELTPSKRIASSNDNAVAIIIGIAQYQRTEVPAIYADQDANYFYDYAALKLGVPERNIIDLVNENANAVEIFLATENFLRRKIKKDVTDVYIFYAGHGLATDDGSEMYLLPYDGAPQLLERTAISRKQLFNDIAASNPRSVTVFLDTCYSGTTRGTETLIASRPIAIKAKQQNIPEGFTVMTAAAGDQTAKPLEEAKHGMFSYFLMKGMEGDADANQDNQITAGELHAYVQQNVIQQSSGSQTPELQGDADRVLVRFQ